MKGIYMKLSNNGEDRASTGHLLAPDEASKTEIGLHLIESLTKVVQWESPNNPGNYKTIGCSSQTDVKSRLL